MKKVYIASPLGFSEGGKFFLYEKFIPLVKKAGFEILDPWTLTDEDEISRAADIPSFEKRKEAWVEMNMIIGENNETAINESDLILAVLDGTDVDSGTAAEIGYGAAKGKPVFGYRGDFRKTGDNEGSIVNLQVEYFINKSGGTIVTSLNELISVLKEYR